MIPSEMPLLSRGENGHGSFHDNSNNIFQGQSPADLFRSGLLGQLSQFGSEQQMQMLQNLHQMGQQQQQQQQQQQKQKEVKNCFHSPLLISLLLSTAANTFYLVKSKQRTKTWISLKFELYFVCQEQNKTLTEGMTDSARKEVPQLMQVSINN